jgi:hypothetical protein
MYLQHNNTIANDMVYHDYKQVRSRNNGGTGQFILYVGVEVLVCSHCQTYGKRGIVTDINKDRVTVSIDGVTVARTYLAKNLMKVNKDWVDPMLELSSSRNTINIHPVIEPYGIVQPMPITVSSTTIDEPSAHPNPHYGNRPYIIRSVKLEMADSQVIEEEMDSSNGDEGTESSDDEVLSIAQVLNNEFDIGLQQIMAIMNRHDEIRVQRNDVGY